MPALANTIDEFFLLRSPRIEAVKICLIRSIALYGCYIPSDFGNGGVKPSLLSTGDKYVSALCYEPYGAC
jgi:hypothetical protein